MKALTTRTVVLILVVLVAAMFRLLPHVPNSVPITALALFAGAKFADRKGGLLVVFAAMFVSDLFIGFDVVSPFVYLSLGLVVLIGELVGPKNSVLRIAGGSLLGSLLFFAITNFGVWLMQSIYPKTLEGLLSCYTMAIPFFRHSLTADLIYAAVLFGVFAFVERKVPSLLATQSGVNAVG